jgi:aryl-alcohol dehydrogenase-like predicted oxidoreductase
VNFFETADVYGGGHGETLLGRALAGQSARSVVSTKFGFAFDPFTRQMLDVDASPAYVRRACEGSLRRLRCETIDLYQFHVGEYDPAYLDDVCDVLERLGATGKIRAYGWCTWADRLEGARGFAAREHCASIQCPANVLHDAPKMMALSELNRLACINNSPLAMALLTGKYDRQACFPVGDVRQDWNLRDGLQARQLAQVEALREVLTDGGRTLAQGALAWLWARSPTNLPISGFKTLRQVEENAAAMQFGPLSPDLMRQAAEILAKDATVAA